MKDIVKNTMIQKLLEIRSFHYEGLDDFKQAAHNELLGMIQLANALGLDGEAIESEALAAARNIKYVRG